ncbi:MAG: thioredoxin [Euryarchaeota archaeon]|nr:thioredoxin [Euryarchaeota archaeon]
MAGNVAEVTDDNFQEFIKDDKPVLVDCWAPWCAPCRRLSPIIEELATELEGEVKFGKLNTDDNPSTAQQNGIMSIPTMLVYKNGEKVDQLIGALPKAEILNTLKKHT